MNTDSINILLEIVFLHPQSVNIVHGKSVVFNCTTRATNVFNIQYIVNGTSISSDKLFSMSKLSFYNSTYASSLTVVATVLFNNTNISCNARTIGNAVLSSKPAQLLVQGDDISI